MKHYVELIGRFCEEYPETMFHAAWDCTVLLYTEYKSQHGRVGQYESYAYMYYKICNIYGKENKRNRHNLCPDPSKDIEPKTILWDFKLHKDNPKLIDQTHWLKTAKGNVFTYRNNCLFFRLQCIFEDLQILYQHSVILK